MRTSWEKLTQYVGTTYGQDIRNDLENKTPINFTEPNHSAAVLVRHAALEEVTRAGQNNLKVARRSQVPVLEAAVTAGIDADAPMKLSMLQNYIAQADFEMAQDVPIKMNDYEKTQ